MIFAVPSVLKVIGGRNFILGGFLEIKIYRVIKKYKIYRVFKNIKYIK